MIVRLAGAAALFAASVHVDHRGGCAHATYQVADPSLLCRIVEQWHRRALADWQGQLVQVRQVIKVIRRDGAARDAVEIGHHRAIGDLLAGFDQADGRLGATDGIGQLPLGPSMLFAPVRQFQSDPPGSVVERPQYCAGLYFVASDKLMTDAKYNDFVSNVLVMHPGNRLRGLRKAKGLTQNDLADLTGVSQPAISQIENGVLAMDIQWMRAFARILGVTPADLLEDADNPDRLSDDERQLLARYRAADAAQRASVARVVDALVAVPDQDTQAA